MKALLCGFVLAAILGTTEYSWSAQKTVTFVGTIAQAGTAHGGIEGNNDKYLMFEMIPEIGGKIYQKCDTGDMCEVKCVIDTDIDQITKVISVKKK